MVLMCGHPPKALSLAFASISLLHSATAIILRRGSAAENNILANCVDQHGVKSSQMAYYIGAVNSSPDSVALVSTGSGLTQVWEGTGPISATFADGDVFTVTIPHPVPNGAYAGAGKNDYGPFSCWYDYAPNVYNWGDNSCDMIYDCNHQAAPTSTPVTLSTAGLSTTTTPVLTSTPTTANTSTSASTTATASSPQPADPSPSSLTTNVNSNRGLSQGEIAGIVVGVVGAVATILAVFIAYLQLRLGQRD